MARLTGLEPVTSGVTGRHSDQLNYNRILHVRIVPRIAVDVNRLAVEILEAPVDQNEVHHDLYLNYVGRTGFEPVYLLADNEATTPSSLAPELNATLE